MTSCWLCNIEQCHLHPCHVNPQMSMLQWGWRKNNWSKKCIMIFHSLFQLAGILQSLVLFFNSGQLKLHFNRVLTSFQYYLWEICSNQWGYSKTSNSQTQCDFLSFFQINYASAWPHLFGAKTLVCHFIFIYTGRHSGECSLMLNKPGKRDFISKFTGAPLEHPNVFKCPCTELHWECFNGIH